MEKLEGTTKKKGQFEIGDQVKILDGKYAGVNGEVKKSLQNICIVEMTENGDPVTTAILNSELVHLSEALEVIKPQGNINDRVEILEGIYKGRTATIYRIQEQRNRYQLYMDKLEFDDNRWHDIQYSGVKIIERKAAEQTNLGKALTDLLEPSDNLKPGLAAAIEVSKKVKTQGSGPVGRIPSNNEPAPVLQQTAETQMRSIPLHKLVASKTNPRKTFDEQALQEIAESIRSVGVIQPITVRPHKDFIETYEVICGERRFRAAKIAELEEIPAVIRSMSDDEVLDIQIIENLQRKDVHPMDEAAAFRTLRDKIAVSEIAIRVGKSEKYVFGRIKLNDLIPEFQEMFFADRMRLKSAFELARISGESQQSIFSEVNGLAEWKEDEDFQYEHTYAKSYVERASESLGEVPFDLDDKDLDKKAGACTTCQFNTANQPLLFGDDEPSCSKRVCLYGKIRLNAMRIIEQHAHDPEYVLLDEGSEYSTNETSDVMKDFVSNSGLSLLKQYDDYRTYNVENGPNFRKGIVVAAYSEKDIGEIKEVYLTDKGSSKSNDDNGGATEARSKILNREVRAKELDNQKIIAAVQPLIGSLNPDEETSILSYKELGIITDMLYNNAGYESEFQKYIRDLFEFKGLYGRNITEAIVEGFRKNTEEPSYGYSLSKANRLMDRIIRKYIFSHLATGTFGGDPYQTSKGYMTDIIARSYVSDYIKIQEKQQSIANKRQERVNKKLEEING